MQAFKIPMRLIQTTRTLLIGDNLVFELHGNRGKSAYMFSFHVTIAIGQLRSQHTVFPSFSRVFKMKSKRSGSQQRDGKFNNSRAYVVKLSLSASETRFHIRLHASKHTHYCHVL